MLQLVWNGFIGKQIPLNSKVVTLEYYRPKTLQHLLMLRQWKTEGKIPE